MLKDSKVLVTGSEGFIGKHLCSELEARGAKVNRLDAEDGGVTNIKLIYRKCEGVDYVFHLGAVSAIPACERDMFGANEVNVTGTFNLLTISSLCKVKRVVFASSSVVHEPRTMYAVTKVIGEQYCKFFRDTHKLPISMLRFYNVYGPGQESDTAVIPSFIRKLKADEPLIIEGSGLQTRDFIYVEDIVDAMIQAANEGFSGYCDIGTGQDISINDLADTIKNLMGVQVDHKHTAPRAGDVDKSVAKDCGWFSPKYSLIEGLTETIESWQ